MSGLPLLSYEKNGLTPVDQLSFIFHPQVLPILVLCFAFIQYDHQFVADTMILGHFEFERYWLLDDDLLSLTYRDGGLCFMWKQDRVVLDGHLFYCLQ